jgi:hypothetical protein
LNPRPLRYRTKQYPSKTGGQTKYFAEHCGIPGVCVPRRNISEDAGYRGREIQTKRPDKRGGYSKARTDTDGSESENQNKERTQAQKEIGEKYQRKYHHCAQEFPEYPAFWSQL